ncbi:MAG: ABC transporter permease [candidate division Zixibacteria bacterium]|nr:ABC transporter permease [candidate division Zixibacteria bacterium]
MLGIIIGVGAVVAMVAIGRGAQKAVETQIASLGTNFLMIYPGASQMGGVSGGASSAQSLTEDDVKAIREQCPSVGLTSPTARANRQVVAGNLNWSTSIQGGTTEFFSIRDWRIKSGEIFTDQDVRGATKVCVIGATVAKNLFPDQDPVGQTVRIAKLPFRVVGVLAEKGQNAMGMDQDDLIIAPFATVQSKLMRNDHLGAILASAVSADRIPVAQREIVDLLRMRHRLADWQDNDFTVRTQSEISAAAGQTTQIMTMLLGSIASVSLLVGGIGIMNIMLVSVTERTREIGIRMAIGARRRDILKQFLIESAMLSMLGGIVGVGLGTLVVRIIALKAGWPVLVSIGTVGMAFGFATFVGVFFGLYPAGKASKLNPIEALRYE